MSDAGRGRGAWGGRAIGRITGLAVLLVVTGWWRGHTFAPAITEATGWSLWPAAASAGEPLDCDEAAYGYMGRRLNAGAYLYRDLTENKPPAGYWLYAAADRWGGPRELSVRLLGLLLAATTIGLVWLIALRLGGIVAAMASGWAFLLLSTDPFLYGNGTQLEMAMNLGLTAGLGALVVAQEGTGEWSRRAWLLVAGVCLGAAAMVKQVAVVHLVAACGWVIASRRAESSSPRVRAGDAALIGAGWAVVALATAGVLLAHGTLPEAARDILEYGRALATDTPADANAPPWFARWLTGNADPEGRLPWPFGETDYLVWWGTGTWPLWIAGVAAAIALAVRGRGGRLLAIWIAASAGAVVLPGLYWPHYYLLMAPGLALAIGVGLARAVAGEAPAGMWRRLGGRALAAFIVAALLGTTVIQVRDYLLVEPVQLAVRYKGGAQWVALRQLGRDIGRRARVWPDPRLHVWGWQSPLYYYSGLETVTPQFFVDPLTKAYATGGHPVVTPRLERMMRDLRARPPELVFAGDVPFPELLGFLRARYVGSRLLPPLSDGRGLWVEPGRAEAFDRPTGGLDASR